MKSHPLPKGGKTPLFGDCVTISHLPFDTIRVTATPLIFNGHGEPVEP